ncbi:MAG TPA: AAA family ATPase [Candidatus Limnocylindrales bacterium]|nr:AAA family ATPase [Candidatus Limnocylindrales bacterium]
MKRAGSVLCPVIVGRDDVLDLLDELVAATARGRGRTLFLAGSAGLGKTRLIRATLNKAQAAGIRFEGGMVAPQDHLVPLASIRDLAAGLRGSDEWGSLGEDLLAVDGRHDGDALGSRRMIVREVGDRILSAIDRPTMLVFDDLHWTDELSLEVIGELARHAADQPLLLVAGYRPDEFPPDTLHREWRARLLSQRVAEEVRLEPLTVDQTAVATTLILGGELPAPRDVVEAVHERTNGIPLHIEELLGALDPEDSLDGRRIRAAHVPDTIGDAVLARMDRLSDEARLVARAGAVIGRCFSPDVIAGMVGRHLAELEPTLEELVDAAILRPFNYVDEGYYDFRHQLLRDAIYNALPPAQLRRFHAQAAEFGMTLQNQSVIHASRHYERAGLRPQAFRTALAAAGDASRISARQEAYELYRRAIDNMPPDLPIDEQAALYERFADAAGAIEHNEECATAALRARELYLQAGRPVDAAALLLTLSVLAARDGMPHAEQRDLTDRVFRELESQPPSEARERLRAFALSARADHHFVASDLEAARRVAGEARAVAEAVGDRETVLETELTLARIDITAGRYESGLRDGMRAARAARDAGYEGVGVTGFRNLAMMAARVLDQRSATVALDEGLQYADAIEQSHCRQMMATTTALLDWAAGRWDAADERARHELVDRGCRRGLIGSLDVIGLVALGRGRLEEARRWLDESLESGRRIDEIQFLLTPLWGLAETDLLAGDAAAAVARCDEGLVLAETRSERALLIPFVVTGVRSLLSARRPDDAERWLARARDHLAGWEPIAGPALAHADGLIRMAGGSLVGAREALERAVRGWEERGRIWEATWGRLDLAQCLARSNRHADAATILGEARASATALRSGPILARVEDLARAGRGRGIEDEPWRPLTVREFEVARLIAEGLTNGQIADRLDIAPKTASSHVEHILAKLGVTRRAEVAAWAASVGGAAREQPTPGTRAAPAAAVGPR